MRWFGSKVFVGRALIGELLGLEPFGEGYWKVWFSFFELGVFDERKLLIRTHPKSVAAPK